MTRWMKRLAALTAVLAIVSVSTLLAASIIDGNWKADMATARIIQEDIDRRFDDAHPRFDAAEKILRGTGLAYDVREERLRFEREHCAEAAKQRDALHRKAVHLRVWSKPTRTTAVWTGALAGAGLFILAGAWILGVAKTRGQRAGVILLAASIAPLVYFHIGHGTSYYYRYNFARSIDFKIFLVLAGAGVLLLLRLPQRVLAWVSGGTKD